LRALKYVLVSAGNMKREQIAIAGDGGDLSEQHILIQAVCLAMLPKLVPDDIALLFSLLSDVFPGVAYEPQQMTKSVNLHSYL
jgi:dynein heavy chain 1